jgi:hypothetical protein
MHQVDDAPNQQDGHDCRSNEMPERDIAAMLLIILVRHKKM